MNKAHWLSVALDGTVEAEKIRFLVDMSYELTNTISAFWYTFLLDLKECGILMHW
jgi:hypothetical protein